MLIEQEHKPKLAPRTKTCMYLGPNMVGEGCRFYDPVTKRTIVSCSATFFEVPMLIAGPAMPVPDAGAPTLHPVRESDEVPCLTGGLPPTSHSSILPLLGESRLALQDKSPEALTQGEKGSSDSVSE